MPKYFSGERPLPFPKVSFTPSELTPSALSALFARRKENTVCLTFDGFEPTCLGFLVHIRKNRDRYELMNIKSKIELLVQNEKQLVEVIKHISGVEYSGKAQKAFQQIRNDIGGVLPGVFSDES